MGEKVIGHSLGGFGRWCGGRRGYGVCDQDYNMMFDNCHTRLYLDSQLS